MAAELVDLEDVTAKTIQEKLGRTAGYGHAGTQLTDQCVDIQESTRSQSGSRKKRRMGSSSETTVASEMSRSG